MARVGAAVAWGRAPDTVAVSSIVTRLTVSAAGRPGWGSGVVGVGAASVGAAVVRAAVVSASAVGAAVIGAASVGALAAGAAAVCAAVDSAGVDAAVVDDDAARQVVATGAAARSPGGEGPTP
ncbi:MAG: hypothetical protein R3F65_17470 [bacterium]